MLCQAYNVDYMLFEKTILFIELLHVNHYTIQVMNQYWRVVELIADWVNYEIPTYKMRWMKCG